MPERKNLDGGTSPVMEYKDRCRIADAGCISASMPMSDP
jgi:hypothetical protein